MYRYRYFAIFCASAVLFTGLGRGTAAEQAQPRATAPQVVVPVRVSSRLEGAVIYLLKEFSLITTTGPEGRGVKAPKTKVRAAVLKVLADQGLIASDTEGVGTDALKEKFEQQVLYTLYRFGLVGSGGGGTPTAGSIETAHLTDSVITTVKITDSAVTTAKLADGAATTAKLADGAVTTVKLADKSVTAAKINSESASAGMVLTADGAGGASWAAGGGSGTVTESDLSLSDVTTNDVSTTKHGFAPKLPNDASKYLDGTGNWTVPAGGGVSLPVTDDTSVVKDDVDGTKQLRFEVSGITTGTVRVATPPDADFTMARTDAAQTFTGLQTFSSSPTSPTGGTDSQRFGPGAGAAGAGGQCTFVGHDAGKNSTADNNTCVGNQTGRDTTTGKNNTFVGDRAGYTNVIGRDNIYVGQSAGYENKGDGCVIIGRNAGENWPNSYTANYSTIVGTSAGQYATGNNNTLFGYNAGLGSTGASTYTNNTAVGYEAGKALTTGSNNVFIGYQSGSTETTASNQFIAGSDSAPLDNIWFGKGKSSATPTAYTINGTASSQNGTAGGDLQIAGGKANQAADAGGSIKLQTAAAGSGTTLNNRVIINSTGITSLYKGADVASAGTITPTGNIFHVTGTGTVNTISTTGITAGTTLILIFDAGTTVTVAGNIKMSGGANFAATADDTLTVVYDGTSWFEVSRSVN